MRRLSLRYLAPQGLAGYAGDIGVRFHHGWRGRKRRVVCRGNNESWDVGICPYLVEVAPGSVSQHYRTRGLVDALSPDNFPVGVFLQQLNNRL